MYICLSTFENVFFGGIVYIMNNKIHYYVTFYEFSFINKDLKNKKSMNK